MTTRISHALVLPDQNFNEWYRAAEPYTRKFERVVVVRSPAGNDLNRYRNITAVQAPSVWFNNDALAHIRRAYPSVVRVDLIRASTPAELANILNARITLNDRYGETQNTDSHLNDRFVLNWPSDGRPATIKVPFNADLGGGRRNEGIDVYAPLGLPVRAAAGGVVATVMRQQTQLGYGAYVQIGTRFGGQNYLITYARLQNITVQTGQTINIGDPFAQSAGPTIRLIVQRPGSGTPGYVLPDVLDPTPLIYWDGLTLRTSVEGLRVREKQGTEFTSLGQVYAVDTIETLETHGRTLEKIGDEGRWLRVRTPAGIEGYAAAWYLSAVGPEASTPPVAGNMTGMNLDMMHPLGRPSANRLKGLGWVRFAYNVSMGRGSTDFNAAFNLYRPYFEAYANAGIKIILILTHQTYGEGTGYDWTKMTSDKWRQLSRDFANVARDTAGRFAGKGLISAYQIWNEQDTPPGPGAVAAVPIPPADYGFMLGEAIRGIRSVDANVKIITGGHVIGPAQGAAYARTTLAAMPAGIRPDGIAFHAYGRGVSGTDPRYAPFGTVGEAVRIYSRVMPERPVWITEWGVLDRPGDSPTDIARYATQFLTGLKRDYADGVAAAIWYAWADTMHNGYGLVNERDQAKAPLYEQYLRA